jgi:outer membrane protein assembly factor BamC
MTKNLLLLVTLSTLAGCSWVMPQLDKVMSDNRNEYKKSRTMPDLDVPPDLTSDAIRDRMAIPEGGETATYSTYQERTAQRKQQAVTERTGTQAPATQGPATEAIKVVDGEHTLTVQGAPAVVWPKLQKFIADAGYKLELNDEALGVIETVWDENTQEMTRQKFKIYIQAATTADTTLLYVAQRAEIFTAKDDNERMWQATPSDPAQELAMVTRLQSFLVGVPAPAANPVTPPAPQSLTVAEAYGAAAAPAATTTDIAPAAAATLSAAVAATAGGVAEIVSAGGEKIYLSIQLPMADAWTQTGVALERAGFAVDQADKAGGIYYLRVPVSAGATKQRGLLSKLKFWGKDEDNRLQLNLTGVGTKTEAVLLDPDGRWETGEIAHKLLQAVEQGLEAHASN